MPTSTELATKIDKMYAEIHTLQARQKAVGIREARKLAKQIKTIRNDLVRVQSQYEDLKKKGGKTRRRGRRSSKTRRA